MPHCFGHQQPYSCSQSAADSITYVEVRVGVAAWPKLATHSLQFGLAWVARAACRVVEGRRTLG